MLAACGDDDPRLRPAHLFMNDWIGLCWKIASLVQTERGSKDADHTNAKRTARVVVHRERAMQGHAQFFTRSLLDSTSLLFFDEHDCVRDRRVIGAHAFRSLRLDA